MAIKKTLKLASPMRIMQDLWGAWRSYTLAAAVELDIFTHIAGGRSTASQIASQAGLSERKLQRLLEALTGLQYLRKKGSGFALEPVAEQYLVRGGELYMEGLAAVARSVPFGWSQLAEVVKSGNPVGGGISGEEARQFFKVLVRQIFPLSYTAACAAVAALPKKSRDRIGRILDVAAGSGAWSIAFARAIPAARVTALDFPEVIPVAREFAERFGVASRYDYLEGNLRETDLGDRRYDLVILGQILHSEGEAASVDLIKRSYRALKDQGMLLIAEMVPNDRRSGPLMPVLFGLNMMLFAPEGDVFTMRQMRGWLGEAGFRKVGTIKAPGISPLILAVK